MPYSKSSHCARLAEWNEVTVADCRRVPEEECNMSPSSGAAMSRLSSVALTMVGCCKLTPPDISKQGEPECGVDLMIWDEAGIRTRPRVASHLSYFFWIFTQPRISTRAIIYRYKDLHTIYFLNVDIESDVVSHQEFQLMHYQW